MGGNTGRLGRARDWPGANRVLAALLLLAVVKSLLWTVAIPPWRAPDEPQHFGYVEHLRRERSVPLDGSAYLYPDILVSLERTNFAGITGAETTAIDPASERNNPAAQHPPLFYTLALPFYLAGGGAAVETQLYLVRLANVLVFAVLIAVSYRFARLAFPGAPYLQAGVPLMMIFHPQLGFISAGALNDALLVLLFTLFLYQLTVIALGDFSAGRAALLGVTVGLGMLTKSSFAIALPVGLVVLVALMVARRDELPRLLRAAGTVLGIALVICSWYYLRNYLELGVWQPVYTGERYGADSLWELMFATSFRADLTTGFLGNFSWLSIPLPPAAISGFTRIAQLAFLGFIAAMVIGYRRRSWRIVKPWIALLFAGVTLLYLAAAAYYELTVSGAQGRYLFPAAFAIWSLLLIGLVGWMPPSWRPRATAIVVSAAAAFSLWSLFHEFVGRVT